MYAYHCLPKALGIPGSHSLIGKQKAGQHRAIANPFEQDGRFMSRESRVSQSLASFMHSGLGDIDLKETSTIYPSRLQLSDDSRACMLCYAEVLIWRRSRRVLELQQDATDERGRLAMVCHKSPHAHFGWEVTKNALRASWDTASGGTGPVASPTPWNRAPKK